MSSRTPGIVDSVDRARREVRVSIPGLTDNADVFPLAEIEYPIGDNSQNTEIRISAGDKVWLDFINGDTRYPIITGYRTVHIGNEVGTRRWSHDNIETDADETQKHTAGTTYRIESGESVTILVGDTTIVCEGDKVTITTQEYIVDAPQSTFTGEVRIDQGLSVGDDVVTDLGISHNDHPHTGNLGRPTSPPLPA